MNFTKSFKLSSLALATSLAFAGAAVTTSANAEIGYNAAVSSMYLWRGQDVSQGPAISGGIDFSDESGFYASAWASSGFTGDPAVGGGYELDLFAGFAGEIGGFGYDISYWEIMYPQVVGEDSGNETILGLSYENFSLGYVDGEDDYSYTTVGAEFGAFSVLYGMSDDGADAEYTHVDLTYAATDALSFTYSKASDDGAGVSEEGLVMVSYSLPIGK